MMHLTLSSLLCSELSFVCNQAAEVDYRLVTEDFGSMETGKLRAKEQVDHGLLEAVQILCGEHGSKIRSIRCCRAGIHFCTSRGCN
jgi:hypothetical protein